LCSRRRIDGANHGNIIAEHGIDGGVALLDGALRLPRHIDDPDDREHNRGAGDGVVAGGALLNAAFCLRRRIDDPCQRDKTTEHEAEVLLASFSTMLSSAHAATWRPATLKAR